MMSFRFAAPFLLGLALLLAGCENNRNTVKTPVPPPPQPYRASR